MQVVFFNLFLILGIFFSILEIYPENLNLKISLKNGTTNQLGKADSLKIIALSGGMIPIAEFKEKTGSFTIENLNVPDNSPILIQASYKNTNYNKIVPPVASFREKVQEILIYETTDSTQKIDSKSLIQIIRDQNEIRIFKVYLILNKTNPPMSYWNQSKPFQVYIPEEANDIQGSLTQGDSKMPIPLSLPKKEQGRILDRAILPGSSELQISYTLPAENLKDIQFVDKILPGEIDQERILFYKPPSMNVEIQNAKESIPIEEGIPSGVGAYSVKYSENGIIVSVSGGTPVINQQKSEQRKIVNGYYFNTWYKSLFGILGLLSFLFTIYLFYIKSKMKSS
jgi:hypothetical protein